MPFSQLQCMKMFKLVSAVMIAFLLAQSAPVENHYVYIPIVSNYRGLQNGGFEINESGNCEINGVPAVCPQEVRPPSDWTAWWYNQQSGVCDPHKTGQIELSRFDIDPFRIASGGYSLKYFTFWRCHWAGIKQRVVMPEGWRFATAKVQSWYSSCSSKPYHVGEPLDENCQPAPWAKLEIRIGIESNGIITWGVPVEAYNEWKMPGTPMVYTDGTVTLWIESKSNAPLKHNDVYIDEVTLQ